MRYFVATSINPAVFPVWDNVDQDYADTFSSQAAAQAYCDEMNAQHDDEDDDDYETDLDSVIRHTYEAEGRSQFGW